MLCYCLVSCLLDAQCVLRPFQPLWSVSRAAPAVPKCLTLSKTLGQKLGKLDSLECISINTFFFFEKYMF